MGWQLWRQDDNGNRFLVAVLESRRAAELRMEKLTRHPHKQVYWIQEGSGGDGQEQPVVPVSVR